MNEPKIWKFSVEYSKPVEINKINRKTNNVTIQNDETTKTIHANKLERPSELARFAAASENSQE